MLGWDAAKQDGQFVPGDKPFENAKGGQQVAQGLISQGADIIFPVAGPAGEGALQAAKASGGKVNAIWVDTDGCVSAATYCPQIMTSVYKGLGPGGADADQGGQGRHVHQRAVRRDAGERGHRSVAVQRLRVQGPGRAEGRGGQIKADIIAGTIKITSKSQPSS